jgi:hypothetical protein
MLNQMDFSDPDQSRGLCVFLFYFYFFAFSRLRSIGLLCGTALLGVLGWCSFSFPFSFLPRVL